MIFKLKYRYIKGLLDKHQVNFHLSKDRPASDDIISFNSSLALENYTCFAHGNNICTMGSYTYSISPLLPELVVGRYCSIARGLEFFSAGHPVDHVSLSPFTYGHREDFIFRKPFKDKNLKFSNSIYIGKGGFNDVIIGNDCWIGQNVTIKFGCKIGDGAIVAANSLVTKDVPPYAVVGGIPAKVIKYRFNDDLIEKFKKLKWWEYDVTDLNGLPFEDPNKFIEEFQLRVKSLKKYNPKCLTAKDLLSDYYKNIINHSLPSDVCSSIRFNYHFSKYGWLTSCANDAKVELDQPLEALQVIIDNNFISVNYSVLVKQNWFEQSSLNSEFSGTVGQKLAISGIKLKCDSRKIFYRIKCAKDGWSEVYSDGQPVLAKSGMILGIHIAIS